MSLLMAVSLVGALIQPTPAPQGAVVSGRVLEEGTRAPIAGAQVVLIPSAPRPAPLSLPDQLRTAITDQNGRYQFDDVDAGGYHVDVQKAGFARSLRTGPPEVQLKAGERRQAADVMLQKGAVIAGRVLDEAGEPLINANVTPMQRPAGPPDAVPAPPGLLFPAGQGAQTNDIGEFRVFGLPAGEYYLQATLHSEFSGGSAQRARTLLPTYFPGTSDPAAAQPISLGAGETSAEVVIRMLGAAAFQVSGIVCNDAEAPVVNAVVKLVEDVPHRRRMFLSHPRESRTDASGRFVINNVTNGTYTLLAIAPVLISRHDPGAFGASGVFGSVSASGVDGFQVMTETRNGTTVQYRDDHATRVPVVVNEANVGNLEVVVRAPRR